MRRELLVGTKIAPVFCMEMLVSKLTYYCNRSVALYTSAIGMAEKANLRDIFRRLKGRRLKLLQAVKRNTIGSKTGTETVHIDNLTDLLSEIKSNEEHLIELSAELIKNNRVKSSGLKELVKSSNAEITSSLHWLDIIASYYSRRTPRRYLSIK